jgi:hypothetical protein
MQIVSAKNGESAKSAKRESIGLQGPLSIGTVAIWCLLDGNRHNGC